jgi:hypothetical protein
MKNLPDLSELADNGTTEVDKTPPSNLKGEKD